MAAAQQRAAAAAVGCPWSLDSVLTVTVETTPSLQARGASQPPPPAAATMTVQVALVNEFAEAHPPPPREPPKPDESPEDATRRRRLAIVQLEMWAAAVRSGAARRHAARLNQELGGARVILDTALEHVQDLQQQVQGLQAMRTALEEEVGHLTGQLAEQEFAHEHEMANEVQARQAAEAQAATLQAALNAVEEKNGVLQQQLNGLQNVVEEHKHHIPLYYMPAGHEDARGRSLGGGYTQYASGDVRLFGKVVSNAEAVQALAALAEAQATMLLAA